MGEHGKVAVSCGYILYTIMPLVWISSRRAYAACWGFLLVCGLFDSNFVCLGFCLGGWLFFFFFTPHNDVWQELVALEEITGSQALNSFSSGKCSCVLGLIWASEYFGYILQQLYDAVTSKNVLTLSSLPKATTILSTCIMCCWGCFCCHRRNEWSEILLSQVP